MNWSIQFANNHLSMDRAVRSLRVRVEHNRLILAESNYREDIHEMAWSPFFFLPYLQDVGSVDDSSFFKGDRGGSSADVRRAEKAAAAV